MKRLKKVTIQNDNDYNFQCFLINIENPSINKTNFITQTDFFHEYIHYLQSISCPFLFSQFTHFANKLATIGSAITKESVWGVNDDYADKIAAEFFDFYYLGNLPYIKNNSFSSIDTILGFEKKDLILDGTQLKTYTLKFMDTNGEDIDHIICGRDLLENLAIIIEEAYYGPQNQLPDIPYRIVDNVINSYYSSLTISKYQIAQLIEFSLNTIDPVAFLFEQLDRLSNEENIPSDLYTYIFSTMKFMSIDGKNFTVETLAGRLLSDSIKSLTNILGNIALADDTNYIVDKLGRGINYRFTAKNSSFIADLITKKTSVNDLIKLFGLPLVHFHDDTIYSTEFYGQKPTLIPAILESVYEALTYNVDVNNGKIPECSGAVKCILTSYCQEHDNREGTHYFSVECMNNPYKRVDIGTVNCPYPLYLQSKKLI